MDTTDSTTYANPGLVAMTIVSRQKFFLCTHCPNAYDDMDVFRKHLDVHRLGALKACTICGKLCFSELSLKQHYRTHAKDKFTCTICGNAYKYKRGLTRHMRTVHTHKPPLEEITKSEFEVPMDSNFELDDNLENENGAGFYVDKEFRLKEFTIPIQRMTCVGDGVQKWNCGGGQDVWYVCGKCGRGYTSVSATLHHSIQCTVQFHFHQWDQFQKKKSRSKYKHLCSVCSKSFCNPAGVRRHELIHSEKLTLVQCPKCGAEVRSHRLQIHIANQHGNFKSRYCDKVFASYKVKYRHEQRHKKSGICNSGNTLN